MLGKSSRGVLCLAAALRAGRSHHAEAHRTEAYAPSLAAALPAERRVLARLADSSMRAELAKRTRRGWAGENDNLFEHSEMECATVLSVIVHRCAMQIQP